MLLLTDPFFYLKDIGFGIRPSGSGSCTRTVTYNGRCYYGGAANYAMWGKINKLCFDTFNIGSPVDFKPWSLPWAEAAAFAYKWNYHPFGDEERQAYAFTAHGYGLPLLHPGISGCQPSTKPVKNYAFQFRWLPYRNPDNKP